MLIKKPLSILKWSLLIIPLFLLVYSPMEVGSATTNWGNASFPKCRDIIIDSVGSQTLTYFPAFMNISHEEGMQEDYDDIRFFDGGCDGGTRELAYEIENYTMASDGTNISALMWVEVPSIPSTGTTIGMYYGNDTADSGQNVSGVWDEHFMMVQHLQETSGTHYDSSQFGNNGTIYQTLQNQQGVIDGADYFDGAGDRVDIREDPSLNMSYEMTVSAWVYITDVAEYVDETVISKAVSGQGYQLMTYVSGTAGHVYTAIHTGDATQFDMGTITAGKWYYLATTYHYPTHGTSYKFVDGGGGNTSTKTTLNRYTSTVGQDAVLTIGNLRQEKNYWKGWLDEIRIENTTRSEDWINQTFEMVDNKTFLIVGDEEDYIPPTDSCTYSGSGNWEVTWEDNCTIASPVAGDGSDFILQGCGDFTLNADIKGFSNHYFIPTRTTPICNVYQIGGHFTQN